MTSGGGDAGSRSPGKEDSPAGEANVDGADAEESGYRRDDYWREEAREGVTPGTEPEPEGGFAFESTEERIESGRGAGGSDAEVSKEAREQGDSGGRDDANIVEKG